jgi:hypothetical protein
MTEPLDPSRREFTLASALALLGGVTITISACGGSGNSSMSPVSPQGGPLPDVTGAISANHGHKAVILSAQITADNALTLNIQGEADHNHTLSMTSGDLTQIKNGNSVSKESSETTNHHHTVTFQGPTPAPGGGYY